MLTIRPMVLGPGGFLVGGGVGALRGTIISNLLQTGDIAKLFVLQYSCSWCPRIHGGERPKPRDGARGPSKGGLGCPEGTQGGDQKGVMSAPETEKGRAAIFVMQRVSRQYVVSRYYQP